MIARTLKCDIEENSLPIVMERENEYRSDKNIFIERFIIIKVVMSESIENDYAEAVKALMSTPGIERIHIVESEEIIKLLKAEKALTMKPLCIAEEIASNANSIADILCKAEDLFSTGVKRLKLASIKTELDLEDNIIKYGMPKEEDMIYILKGIDTFVDPCSIPTYNEKVRVRKVRKKKKEKRTN